MIEFELEHAEVAKLRDAKRLRDPMSARMASDRIWQMLGTKYGFFWNTAEPVQGKGPKFIQAEPINYQNLKGI